MRYAYVTRRVAPQGYVAVTKPLAELLYNDGKSVTLCGSNVNTFHIFSGWHLGCTISKDIYTQCFNDSVNSFLSYLDEELGSYVVFYIRREDITFHTPILRQG